MEKGNNSYLSLFDILVTRKYKNIDTFVYGRSSQLNRVSNHPGSTKWGVQGAIYHQSVTIWNTPKTVQKEDSNRHLRKCVDPDELMDHVIQRYQMEEAAQKQQEGKPLPRLPYVKRVTVFYSLNILLGNLSRTKSSTKTNTKYCIYKAPCECW